MISKENEHYFKGLKVGMMTDKGRIDDLYFLTWTGANSARKYYEPVGRGILIAQVNGKAIPIGELNPEHKEV